MVTIPAFWCGMLIAVGVPVVILAGWALWFVVQGIRNASRTVLAGEEDPDDENS